MTKLPHYTAMLAACITFFVAPAQASDDPGVCSVGLNVGRIRLPDLKPESKEKLVAEINASGYATSSIFDSKDEVATEFALACWFSGDRGLGFKFGVLDGISVQTDFGAAATEAPFITSATVKISGDNYSVGLFYSWRPASSTAVSLGFGNELWRFDGEARIMANGYLVHEMRVFETKLFWYGELGITHDVGEHVSVSLNYKTNGAPFYNAGVSYRF